jgi:hypothetical protein
VVLAWLRHGVAGFEDAALAHEASEGVANGERRDPQRRRHLGGSTQAAIAQQRHDARVEQLDWLGLLPTCRLQT